VNTEKGGVGGSRTRRREVWTGGGFLGRERAGRGADVVVFAGLVGFRASDAAYKNFITQISTCAAT
jgi:hypothetical protein